jgi:galactitol-specific phosphotransferase system IIB component
VICYPTDRAHAHPSCGEGMGSSFFCSAVVHSEGAVAGVVVKVCGCDRIEGRDSC